MVVETERLRLRRFTAEDGDALYGFLGDAKLLEYEPYAAFAHGACAREAALRAGSEAFWAICLRAGGGPIGSVTLTRWPYAAWELGFVLRRDLQGQGYATEAAVALVDRAFKVWQAHRVYAMCHPQNMASRRLLERLGLRNEGRLKQNVWYQQAADGAPLWQDTLIYAALQADWGAAHPPPGAQAAKNEAPNCHGRPAGV